jgi:hypothetical protein
MCDEPVNIDLAIHYLQFWPSDRSRFGIDPQLSHMTEYFDNFSSIQIQVAVLHWVLIDALKRTDLFVDLVRHSRLGDEVDKLGILKVKPEFKDTDRQRFEFIRTLLERKCLLHLELLDFGEDYLIANYDDEHHFIPN